MPAELRAGDVAGGGLRQPFVRCPLGNEIDRSADRACRQHTVQHRARPLQHFDALDHLRHDGVDRRNAEQIAVGHARAGGAVEAADAEIVLAAAADRRPGAHRRIVDQHVANGDRLLVLRLFRREVGLVEGRVHHAAIAQQTKLTAGRHLAAGVSRREVVDHRLRRHGKGALHLHGIELHRIGDGTLARSMHRDRRGAGKRVSQAAAGEQPLQRLIDRHRALNTRGVQPPRDGAIDRDLAPRLLPEDAEGRTQRLRRNIERSVLRHLREARRGSLRLEPCRRAKHHGSHRRRQKRGDVVARRQNPHAKLRRSAGELRDAGTRAGAVLSPYPRRRGCDRRLQFFFRAAHLAEITTIQGETFRTAAL